MQTSASYPAFKNDHKPTKHEAVPRAKALSSLVGVFSFCAFLTCFVWFVNSLEGINVDTLFIAIYCSALSVFIARALIEGLVTIIWPSEK